MLISIRDCIKRIYTLHFFVIVFVFLLRLQRYVMLTLFTDIYLSTSIAIHN